MKRHNKHTEVTPATFRRLAKGIRRVGRESGNALLRCYSRNIAKVYDTEATELRKMR